MNPSLRPPVERASGGQNSFANREPVTALPRRSNATKAASTVAVRAGIESDAHHGAVVPPLSLSSNFTFERLGTPRAYDYTRSGNPTRDLFAQALADLEGGCAGVVTASGMAAIHLVLQLVPNGGRVVAPHDCYGGTYRLFESCVERGLFEVCFVDQRDLPRLEDVLEGADLIWIETPSNPLLGVVDLAEVSALAHRAGALCAVDNTFLSPARQTPLEFGADLVVHSTTKYVNGHSDVVGGAVVASTPELGERLAYWCNCLGLGGAPFDSYQSLRGLRTLEARWRLHDENAGAVVALLQGHPAVATVHHPSLPTHPGHEVAARQQRSFGAMVSFELVGDLDQVRVFVESLDCFSLAESLGGVESLVAHPATMTHASMGAEARRAAGIGDQLLRLSVGIEAAEDLVRDLRRGLDRAYASRTVGRVRAASAVERSPSGRVRRRAAVGGPRQ